MARTRTRPALPALLLLLTFIGYALAADADDDAVKETVCDGADCGRGSCELRSGWIPGTISYKCECHPGWTRAIRSIPFSPCNVPECSFNSSCFDLSLMLPRGIPFSDPCVAVNCGAGTCKKDEGFHYHCECDQGNINMLNDTKYPCIDANCKPAGRLHQIQSGSLIRPNVCYAGSLSLQSLLQKLLVASVAMAQLL
ncbi:hypothetical protein PR202_gb08070 [Eleusine coracana subsp. coracana]|uniref:EGF-like domain-containing protein n=1 Tax=Eleusine coracana subsp. coracana TaxID=191504 RepID=A0AAV5EB91_ELECO|nr:hypothetical protein PR202_gb08070 [Eleusine coracana subsp. coracana]